MPAKSRVKNYGEICTKHTAYGGKAVRKINRVFPFSSVVQILLKDGEYIIVKLTNTEFLCADKEEALRIYKEYMEWLDEQ